MAVWSVLDRVNVFGRRRLDAEYYQPDYLGKERVLDRISCQALGDVAFVTDGIHSSPDVVDEGGVPYLSAKSVKDNDFALADTLQISRTQDSANTRTRLRDGDILLTTVGTIGNAAVVGPEILPANIDRHLGLIRLHKNAPFDAYFVSTFLNSAFGRFQSLREATGNVQLNLFIEKIKTLRIPALPCATAVSKYVRDAYALRGKANEHMSHAESALLSALGLSSIGLDLNLFYERQLSEMRDVGRLDAEYFSPRFQSAIGMLSTQGVVIGDVARLVQRRFQPEKVKDRQFQYIEISSLTRDGCAQADTVDLSEAPSRAQWIVNKNDVITSTVRPIRRLSALVLPQQSGYICSSGFAVLQPKSDRIEPEVLLAFLRLPIVCEILDLHTTASMYPAISTTSLMKIPISIPCRSVRVQIASNVRAAMNARRESMQLLSDAKEQIEQMIRELSTK